MKFLNKKICLTGSYIFLIAAVYCVILIVCYCISASSAKNRAVLEKIAELTSAQSEQTESASEYCADKQKELDECNAKIKEFGADYNDYDKYFHAKTVASANVHTKPDKIARLDSEISEKKSELEQLTTGSVVTGSPIVLGAGEFTVGEQIPSGRYKITGSSNLFVYSSDGDLMVNTILGRNSISVPSYTVYLLDGYTIEAHGKNTYTPVE